jgi:catechol 2,3-dioxygenase-like lactoylglutathione lyase family enzyme
MSLNNWTDSGIDLEKAREIAKARQQKNPVKMLHHHAYRCKNAEETRHFYEDILGLPMTAALVEPVDPITNEAIPYLHIYFELGDGSWLAFFDYPNHYKRDAVQFPETDPFAHHIALEVNNPAVIDDTKKKLAAAGIAVMELDHGYCKSIYFCDPNGLRVEFTTNVPVTEKFMSAAVVSAKADIDRWMKMRSEQFPD